MIREPTPRIPRALQEELHLVDDEDRASDHKERGERNRMSEQEFGELVHASIIHRILPSARFINRAPWRPAMMSADESALVFRRAAFWLPRRDVGSPLVLSVPLAAQNASSCSFEMSTRGKAVSPGGIAGSDRCSKTVLDAIGCA